jgi:glycosyltransferase involved in cell wall biosynthesis
MIGALSARELDMPEKAVQFARQAVYDRPNWPEAQVALKDTTHWAQSQKMGESIMTALSAAKPGCMKTILRNIQISPHMKKAGLGMPEKEVPGTTTGAPTIAFYCGNSLEQWGPKSAETGIGASEKMVVDLSKCLAARGMEVSVYCALNCPEGDYEGVHWRESVHFDPELHRDVVVLWRCPQLLEKWDISAGRIYVWMHDVGSNNVWSEQVLTRLDKVLFLSHFQRGLHPAVPDDKVYITRNGIDLERHLYDGTPKQKKIVYISSPDRGWMTAIQMFKDSGLADEGYQLHMFYGFGETWRRMAAEYGYCYIAELDCEMRMLEYEDACKEAADEVPGVVDRGRCGWDVIAQELKEAEIWLYPTQFDEISCVSGMEAMAAGCGIVATDHAALHETLYGYAGWTNLGAWDREKWGSLLAAVAGERPVWHNSQWAEHAHKFDIVALAEKWAEDLFDGARTPETAGVIPEADREAGGEVGCAVEEDDQLTDCLEGGGEQVAGAGTTFGDEE